MKLIWLFKISHVFLLILSFDDEYKVLSRGVFITSPITYSHTHFALSSTSGLQLHFRVSFALNSVAATCSSATIIFFLPNFTSAKRAVKPQNIY